MLYDSYTLLICYYTMTLLIFSKDCKKEKIFRHEYYVSSLMITSPANTPDQSANDKALRLPRALVLANEVRPQFPSKVPLCCVR